MERCLDTNQFRYTQVTNHCEAQYEDWSVFIFSSIEDTMAWLALPVNTGAYVIAHFSGVAIFK